jgi:Putative zinc-finger
MSRDRDRTLEQALTHELRAAGAPDRDACVDAETLGAWADGGLDGAQMAAVELHVSTCARCLAIVGATARSAHMAPGTEAAGTFFRWRWWLAPLAATAAAVTLWMVVPQQRDIAVRPSSVVTPATETLAQNQPKTEAVPTEASPATPADTRNALADRARRADTPQQTRANRQERAYSEKKEGSLPAKKDLDAAKPSQEQIAIAGNPAPAAAPSSAPAAAELRKSARLAAAPVEIASPDPSSRWRIVNGAVERSQDGGASWNATPLQAGDSITGGTAPARSICWLIGPGGLVMVTADGLTFARVPLLERVDLTAVTATDALTAVVTTADGRRFRTDDAGRTWRQN